MASSLSAAEVAWAHTRRAYTTGRNVFICPSEFMRHQMIRAGWRVSMHVVHNALPVEPGPPSPGESFLVVGRLSPEKGVDIAADAARIAGVPLIVAGDGPLLDDLRKQYPDVVFTGHLSPTEVRSLVRTARGVVVPSLALENAPMSVLEAMACGTPVVASNIGGIPEQIQHGYSGMLVPPGDVASLAKAMELLTGDRAFAYSLGSHAKKVVSDRFSPHFHLAGLERAYSTVVSGDK